MKEIPLTQGKVALVDDEDYKELNQYKWYAAWSCYTHSFYAQRNSPYENGKRKTISMHRAILGALPGQESDHWNHDTLDNRRENLRICTNSENQYNKRPQKRKNSKYKGICLHKQSHKWQASIRLNGHRYYLGLFTNEIEAARAYLTAAREMFGEFAFTNFGENL